MAERGTARDQLERILYLLPAAGGEDGVSLDELAGALGVSRDVVLDDLDEVGGRAYYLRAGLGDDLRIYVQDERVRVETTGEFRRPPKLSRRETLALGLGLRVVAAEVPGGRREALLELARRLEARLAAYPPDRFEPGIALEDFEDPPVEPGIAPVRGAFARAATEWRRCRFRYLKPAADGPETRAVEPYVVVGEGGRWYVLGRDPDAGGMRIFRLDRVLEVEPLEERFEAPEGFDVDAYLAGGRVFRAADPEAARVRYSPAIARWFVERGEGELREDGSVVAEHPAADPRWAVRHVLQYGPDAELLEPPVLRAEVAAAARNVAHAHAE